MPNGASAARIHDVLFNSEETEQMYLSV